MSNISESLLQAFDVIMDERLSKLRYDKSIQATIKKIQDVATGKYSVEYTGGVFDAYSEDLEKTYKVGEVVWVTIPEGDFSNKKLIRNKVTSSSTSTGQKTDLQNSIFEVSPNFSDLGYTYMNFDSEGKVGLAIYNDGSRPEYDSISVGGTGSEDFQHKFAIYADKYEYIQVSADFKTEFLRNHTKGDYGLLLGFENASGQSVAYTMNLRNFNGNPYALTTWSPQSTIIKIPKGQLTNLSSIVFYQENFDNFQEPPEHSPSSPNEQDELYNTPNLFMRDLSLSFVEIEDLTQQPYYLNIIAENGVLFTSTTANLTLKGQLYYYGEIVESNCVYQWYKQDLSITSASEDYDKRAGWGWKPLVGQNTQSTTINRSDVPWEATYKLVIVYNEEILMEREITLINYNSVIQLAIVQNNENNSVVLLLSDNSYRGNWYYVSSDGNLHDILNGTNVTSVDVTNYLVYSPMTFYCQVDGVGTLSYVMRNFESEKDVQVTFVGENLFSYDANGDVDIRDADTEKRLEVTTIWNNGVISSDCTVEWLDGEGNIIPSSGSQSYCNGNSMISTVRIVQDAVDSSRKILYYKVKHKFKVYPELNNSFRVRITPRGQDPIFFVKQIYFTKTGDPGTNGTTYQALITTNKKFLVDGSTINLTCQVYKDQTPIEDLEITPTITWTLNGLTGGTSGKTITVGNADTSNYTRYAEATIKINDSGNITLYSFAPVYTASSNVDVDLSMLPKYVQYSSNGLNPSFLRQKVSEMPFAIQATTNVSVVDDYLKFPDAFDAANHVALIKLAAAGATIYYPIPMYTNTFGNEAINSWDGVNIGLDDQNRAILAPQVGAGTKDSSTNKFTGVVMGKDPGQSRVGLYGYHDGINSFGLMDNGRAYFGDDGKYRITINPDDGTLQGGLGGSDAAGMTITLAKHTSSTKDSDAIRVGAGNFVVTYGGIVTAKGATIDGHLYALDGKIGSTSKSSSDGWTIEPHRLYSGSGTGRVELNSDTSSDNNYAIWAGNNTASSAPFRVTRKGDLIATSATIKGTITAKTGYIGWQDDSNKGWEITANKIHSNAGSAESGVSTARYIGIQSNGVYAFWAGAENASDAPFYVTHQGRLKASSATIQGSVDASTFKINGRSVLTSGGKIAGSEVDGTTLTVDAARITGKLVANQIDATNLQVSAANVTGKLTATQIDATNLQVSAANITGQLTANQINATNLQIAAGNVTGTLTFGQLPSTVAKTTDGYLTDETIARAIAAGTYRGTFINEKRIASPILTGAKIYGTKFYGQETNTSQAYMQLSDTGNPDLELRFANGSMAFGILWDGGKEGFYVGGSSSSQLFLDFQDRTGDKYPTNVYAYGVWDFDDYNTALVVPHDDGPPNENTPGYGIDGAVYFEY